MKRLFFSQLLILFLNFCFAQGTIELPQFGKIDIADLQMKDCSFEPGASAMNLLKYEDVEVWVGENNNVNITTVTRYRIKVFNKSGFKYANISIPYSDSKITNVQAATYNLDESGKLKVSTVSETDIFKNKSGSKEAGNSLVFAFPDVKEGSIVEYQFTEKEKQVYSIPSWFFQDNIPNLLSACKIDIPVFSHLEKKILGNLPVEEGSEIDASKGEDSKLLDRSFAMQNVPSFKSEPYMSSSRDYRYRADFLFDPKETINNMLLRNPTIEWSFINSQLLHAPFFGWQFETSIDKAKKFVESTRNLTTTAEKVNAVYEYVKHNIKWNDYYYVLSDDLNDVWDKKVGTSVEINLSILNLLRKCGVQCYPVLFSTRLHGMVDYDFPNPRQFNTVDVVAVDGNQFYLLDGTNPYLSYQTIPYNVVNRTGMIIDHLNNSKINVDFGRKLIWDSVFVNGAIDASGILKGSVEKKYFDLAKVAILEDEKEENESDQSENTVKVVSEIKIDSSSQLNKDNALLPLINSVKFHYELPVTDDFYFLNPFLFSDLSENPFIDSVRKTDVDFVASTSFTIQMKIALPKNIHVEELMKNKESTTEDSSITFKFNNEFKSDTLYINSTFKINKPIFDKTEYHTVKAFFQQVYNLVNNQILLRKKEE